MLLIRAVPWGPELPQTQQPAAITAPATALPCRSAQQSMVNVKVPVWLKALKEKP